MDPPSGPGPIGRPPGALPSRPIVAASPIPPALPAANSDGKFSLARQLGLGVSRIVIDAGHGGHDPGAHANGISEAELVLDVAMRLSRLMQKQPGIEVVMTRATDVFIPLEERTVIANREGADLFLSIHANASRSPKARGVETYFLNFASNPEAEAVAARENSASGRAMHSLPDIVRAIALNNKLDESRDFAEMVQRSMVRRLAARNKLLKDLGVKQAPFVVLIGAEMPSVLAEISFVTNKQEGQLLKTGAYRQQIAEALLDAVLRYQQSLKRLKVGPVGIGRDRSTGDYGVSGGTFTRSNEETEKRRNTEMVSSPFLGFSVLRPGSVSVAPLSEDVDDVGVAAVEPAARTQVLDLDQDPAQQAAEDHRDEDQHSGQADRAEQHVRHRGRFHGLLSDLDEDRRGLLLTIISMTRW